MRKICDKLCLIVVMNLLNRDMTMNNTDTQIMSSMESQPEHLNEQENETVPTLRYRDQTLPKSTKRPFFAMTPTPDESISEGFEKP